MEIKETLLHIARKNNQRLGQYFVNTYIKGAWPELYHETNLVKASLMISDWMDKHQYSLYTEIPKLET